MLMKDFMWRVSAFSVILDSSMFWKNKWQWFWEEVGVDQIFGWFTFFKVVYWWQSYTKDLT